MIEIQELKSENWKKLRDLYLELLKSDPEAFVDEYDEIASHTEEQWLDSLRKRGKTFVAVDNGKYVGMGRINFYDELPNVPVLHKLGVLSEYRWRGIATSLIEVREKWAKSEGAKRVRLYIITDRVKMVEFSEKNGYQTKEVLKNNSQRNDGTFVDVTVMEKDL